MDIGINWHLRFREEIKYLKEEGGGFINQTT